MAHLSLRITATTEETQMRPQITDRAHVVHLGIKCSGCPAPRAIGLSEAPPRPDIVGVRFQCVQCQVDLCEACEARGAHDPTHTRLKLSTPPGNRLLGEDTRESRRQTTKTREGLKRPFLTATGHSVDVGLSSDEVTEAEVASVGMSSAEVELSYRPITNFQELRNRLMQEHEQRKITKQELRDRLIQELEQKRPERRMDEIRARMLTRSSGRSNFGDLGWAASDKGLSDPEPMSPDLVAALSSGCSAKDAALVTEPAVVAMLVREDVLRRSPEVQAALDVSGGGSGADVVYLELQRQVAREAGFEDWRVFGVRVLRCAQALFPESRRVREVPLYVRHNRARDGPVAAGEVAPVDGLFLAAMPAGLGLTESEGHGGKLRAFAPRAQDEAGEAGETGAGDAGAAKAPDDEHAAAALGLPWRSLRDHLGALSGEAALPVAVLAGSAT